MLAPDPGKQVAREIMARDAAKKLFMVLNADPRIDVDQVDAIVIAHREVVVRFCDGSDFTFCEWR